MLSGDLKAAEVVIRADKDIDDRVLETEELMKCSHFSHLWLEICEG